MTVIKMVLRDLCVFKYSPEKIVNLDFFDAFKDISQMHVYNTFLGWIKDLHETERRLASNSSIRLTLDRFFLKLSMV
jgi:DNA polymerase-3 subunit delta'